MEKNLLKSLINASEKAANIARIIRKDVNLLGLLIEQKNEDANPRFVKDFKTLADVLIQETIRNDVGQLFPEIRDSIKGEESSTFTNALGDSITVKISDTKEKTMACLERVLNGNRLAADLLSYEVHKEAVTDVLNNVPDLPSSLNINELGIWIDPIDATSEYIAGDTFFTSFPGITSSGLDCVTVLIGVYNKVTGEPIIGVINQPFHKKIDVNSYEGKIFWGVCIENDFIKNNIDNENNENINEKIAVLSSSEHEDIKNLLKSLNYNLAYAAGAGYKALKVITDEAKLYLLSKSTTFKWDTCAPHAILKSLGGGIFDFRKSIKQIEPTSLNYAEDKCNSGGIITIRNMNVFPDLIRVLTE